jgi:hypothetical protein
LVDRRSPVEHLGGRRLRNLEQVGVGGNEGIWRLFGKTLKAREPPSTLASRAATNVTSGRSGRPDPERDVKSWRRVENRRGNRVAGR